jgi:hypothetical protein
VTCRYTEMELQLALLRGDLAWLAALRDEPGWARWAGDVRQRWLGRLDGLAAALHAPSECALLDLAQRELQRGTERR